MRLPWVLWAAAMTLVVPGSVGIALLETQAPTDLAYAAGFALLGVGAATGGAVVWSRVPDNSIGPILLSMGLGLGLMLAAGAYAEASLVMDVGPLPADGWAAWLGSWTSIPVLFGLTAFLLLLFPTGHLLSPRWRWAAWFTAVGVSLAAAASAFTPRRITPGFDNPLGAGGQAADAVLWVEDATDLLALPILLLAAAALSTRLRRWRGAERQQLKLFTFVAAVAGVALGLSVSASTQGIVADLAFLISLYALASLPVAAGVAILRHGLFEIDIVIKRTLVYGSLSATLLATYLVSVLLIRLVLSPVTGDSDLAVAASTLAVAALSRPLRSRIQAVVDHRFYRSRYDAARTLEGFAVHLRDELDLETLGTDLRRAVTDTMQPTHVSLWVREVGR